MRYRNPFGQFVWFLRLWGIVALAVAMLALLEVVFLTANGYRYRPKKSLAYVSVRDMSVIDSSNRASILCLRQRAGAKPKCTKISLLDEGNDIPQSFCLAVVEPHRIALSVDRKLATSTSEGEICLLQLPEPPLNLDAVIRMPLLQATEHKNVNDLSFSANGRFLAANCATELLVWDADSRKRLVFDCADLERFVCHFPDSKRILTCINDGPLRIRELTLPDSWTVVEIEDRIIAAAVAPNMSQILLSNEKGDLMVWSLAENRLLWKKHNTRLPRRIAISSEYAAFVGSNGIDVRICDARTGESPLTVFRHARQSLGLGLIKKDELYSWDLEGRVHQVHLEAN